MRTNAVRAGRRRFARQLAGFGTAALLGRALDARAAEPIAPRYRPPRGGDEAGMWSVMDRSERALAESRFVVRDHGIGAYCREIVCRLLASHCADVRPYVVRAPIVNANLAPNGMLQISTGLLFRCRNEAQLAAIVGHELGHWLRRDAVERWRATRSNVDFSTFWSLGLDAGGADAVGVLNMALVAGSFTYTPDQELAADETAIRLLAGAGYAPAAAPTIWQQLAAETPVVSADRADTLFLANHPDPPERLDAMRRLAAARGGATGDLGVDRYRKALQPFSALLVADELALREYDRSAILIAALLGETPGDGQLLFAQGEISRLRDGTGDLPQAIAAYERARSAPGAPPETLRSLGLVLLKSGRRDAATRAFNEYLQRKPDATDRDAVRALLAS